MKKYNLFLLGFFISLLLLQCNEKASYSPIHQPKSDNRPEILNPHNTEVDTEKPFYQGTVQEVLQAGSYTYLKIAENLEIHQHQTKDSSFWIAVESISPNIGDHVRFQKELVTKNYESKILKRTFDELMFASNIQYKVK